MPIVDFEGYFLLIAFLDPYPIISIGEIELGEIWSSTKLIQ